MRETARPNAATVMRAESAFDARSWLFANLFTLSERINPPAPLGQLR